MKKKIMAMVLAAALAAACLTACSESARTADTEKTESSSSQAQSESVADSESKTESTADSESKSDSESDSKADTSSDSDSSKAEAKKEKSKHLAKIETFDENNTLIYLQEYAYTTDSATGNIECVLTQTGRRIAGDPVTAQSKKSISRYVYNKDFQMLAYYSGTPQILQSEYSYDENGKLVKRIDYDNKGELNLTVVYERGSDGEVVKETQYNRKNEVHKLIEYENGKAVKETWKTTGSVTKNTYDSNGNLVHQDIYLEDGSLGETRDAKYDDRGNKTYYKAYYNTTSTTYKEATYENIYTADGYTVKETNIINGRKQLVQTSYDSDNKILQEIVYDPNSYPDGKVSETTKYTYIEL